MKNKVLIISIIIVLFVLIILGVIIYKKNNIQSGLIVTDNIKPPLKINILKEDIKVGEALGAISSWKYNGSIATSSLVSAKTILEKEDSIVNVEAGDIVKLSIQDYDTSLIQNIYEITYNATDDEENVILPIDEPIDFSTKEINIPILRESLEKNLYYYVTVKIQDKGTIVYFFKL